MKFIKPEREKYTISSAIFFSLLLHVAAGAFLAFCLSTNLISPPKLNGINLVWISFDAKNERSGVEVNNGRVAQSLPAVERIAKMPTNIETPNPNPENIQISTVTTRILANTTAPAKHEASGTKANERPYNFNGDSAKETTDKTSNLKTVIAYPLYKENAPPVYPEIARVRGYEGIVLVSAEILSDGQVGEIKIRKSSGYAILDQSAIQAVKPWKFEPAKKSGSPFTAWVELPIKFILHNNSKS